MLKNWICYFNYRNWTSIIILSKVFNSSSCLLLQWGIEDFPDGERQSQSGVGGTIFFRENCMKTKEVWPTCERNLSMQIGSHVTSHSEIARRLHVTLWPWPSPCSPDSSASSSSKSAHAHAAYSYVMLSAFVAHLTIWKKSKETSHMIFVELWMNVIGSSSSAGCNNKDPVVDSEQSYRGRLSS